MPVLNNFARVRSIHGPPSVYTLKLPLRFACLIADVTSMTRIEVALKPKYVTQNRRSDDDKMKLNLQTLPIILTQNRTLLLSRYLISEQVEHHRNLFKFDQALFVLT